MSETSKTDIPKRKKGIPEKKGKAVKKDLQDA